MPGPFRKNYQIKTSLKYGVPFTISKERKTLEKSTEIEDTFNFSSNKNEFKTLKERIEGANIEYMKTLKSIVEEEQKKSFRRFEEAPVSNWKDHIVYPLPHNIKMNEKIFKDNTTTDGYGFYVCQYPGCSNPASWDIGRGPWSLTIKCHNESCPHYDFEKMEAIDLCRHHLIIHKDEEDNDLFIFSCLDCHPRGEKIKKNLLKYV